MERPIRTPDGSLVSRVALYQDADGVALPLEGLGDSVGDNLTADPPLTVTPAGDEATISILTDAPHGVPTLDGNGLVRMAQMPIAGLNYHGNWDAATNTPTLANGAGTAGDFYRVSTAGTVDLGAGDLVFDVGDHVIYEGSVWQQFDPPQTVAWGDLTGTLADQTDLTAAVDAKADESALTAHTSAANNPHSVTKAQLGLGNVDNTADASKPISTATQTALTAKADQSALTAHTGNTTNPHAVTKAQVGLADVTNDAQVKVSDKASQAEAETGVDGTKWMTPLATAEAIGVHAAAAAPVQSVAGKTGAVTLAKGDVGLANVDNTADTAKPISTATKTYVDTAVAGIGDAGAANLGTPATQAGTIVSLNNGSAVVQLIDTTAGDVTVHLPEESSLTAGRRFIIKRLTAGANGLNAEPFDGTIDGANDIGMASQYSLRDIMFDGTNWQIIGSNGT
jgi:hypothetical protein